MRKDLKGMILADAILGLGILMLLSTLCLGMATVKMQFIYDSDCQQMRDIWNLREVKSICQPKKPLIEIVLEEKEDSP